MYLIGTEVHYLLGISQYQKFIDWQVFNTNVFQFRLSVLLHPKSNGQLTENKTRKIKKLMFPLNQIAVIVSKMYINMPEMYFL